MYKLYQKSYPHWTYKCYSNDDGFPVTPSNVKDVIVTAKELRDYAVAILCIAIVIATFLGVNVLIHLLNSKSYIKKSRARNCSFVRLIATFILCLISAGLLAKMYMDSDPQTL
jgi:fatty-acid desaturase